MTCLMTMPMYGYCEGGHAANNWSEYVPQYEVHFKTQPATCFNNAHVLYAVVDKNNPEEPLSIEALHGVGLDSIRIYHALTELDTTKHHSFYYKGGWDTLTIDYGTYVFGVEGMFTYGTGPDYNVVLIDTNTVLTVGTNYSLPKAAAMSVQAYLPNALGNLPTLDCKNTGRVQLKIERGAYPYTITVTPHDKPDSVLRVVTFDTNQYFGSNENLYDFKDYYSVDMLPAGDWDFYLVDGCGTGLPRTGAIVGTIGVPKLRDIEIYASSGNPYDSNVVRINSVLDNYYHYYLFNLSDYMSYRIYLDTLNNSSTTAWKPYPKPTLPDLNKNTLFDTIAGMKYCEFYDNTIVFEYKFDMPGCTYYNVKDTFHFRRPNPDYFDFNSGYATDSISETSSCGRRHYYHRDYYSVKYRSYEPDFTNDTIDDDNIYHRYHYTYPLYWHYIDYATGTTIKIDTMLDESRNIAEQSRITYDEAYGFYSPANPSFDARVIRRLVGAKGCTLFETDDVLYFDLKMQSEEPGWEITTDAEGHCCATPRNITISEFNSSSRRMDSVDIWLIQSPYDNFYNFKAHYDGATRSWTIDKDNFGNTAEIVGTTDGHRLAINEYCMPSGPYRFLVKTDCGEYEVNKDVEFPEIFRTELVTEPKFAVHAECSDEYIRCTQGKVVRMAFSRDPHTGADKMRIDSLTTYYEIVDGPPGGYEVSSHVKYMLKDSIRISMPGTYIIRVYPDEGGEELCEHYEFFDTICYDGNLVTFDYALDLLCDEQSEYGTAYVKAKSGTPPYTYSLYSHKELQGEMVYSATLDADSTFIVLDTVFENKGIKLSPEREISCLVKDACGSYFHVNFYPQVLADLQKTWFDGGLKADTTCEGATIQIHALSVGDIFKYHWTGPDGFSSISSDPNMFIKRGSKSGWYKVTIYETGCRGDIADSIFLGVNPSPSVNIAPMGEVCPNEEVELKFVPSAGNISAPDATVSFTIMFSNRLGTTSARFENIPSGDTVRYTYMPPAETKIYPVNIIDDACGYEFADENDTVVLKMRSDVITPCHILTNHDTVCYLGTGRLWAELKLDNPTVPYDFPAYVNWYSDYAMTHKLKDTTIIGGRSLYDTAGLTQKTILYVSVDQEGICPSGNGNTNHTMNMQNGAVTSLQCADAIRFYDPGGEGNYPVGTSSVVSHVFVSEDNRPVAIHFDSLNLATPSYLFIFSGDEAVKDSLLYTLTYGSKVPEIIVSNSNKMLLYFSPGPLSSYGWSAVVSPAPAMAIADVWNQQELKIYEYACMSQNPEDYSGPYNVIPGVLTQEQYKEARKTFGVHTFRKIFDGTHGCDSAVIYVLNVSMPAVHDTTVLITSVQANNGGLEWNGQTLTATGEYSHFIPTGGECDSVELLNLIVVQIDTTHTNDEICKGDSAFLGVSATVPDVAYSSKLIPSEISVGDILCSDGHIRKVDSFLLLHGQFPIGVVFFVDSTGRHGKVIAVKDATGLGVEWADRNHENVCRTVRSLTCTNNRAVALNDLDGYGNTLEMKRTAEEGVVIYNVDEVFEKSTPSAYACYYWDPQTRSVGKEHFSFYLPSAGEFSILYANRVEVNKSLVKLAAYGAEPLLNIPEHGRDAYRYWTSTEHTYNFRLSAWSFTREGLLRENRKTNSDVFTVRAAAFF